MVTKYFIDMPSGDSKWTAAGHEVVEEFTRIAKAFLDRAEMGGPVHLREFGFLMEYAVHGVITGASIDRRLGVGSLGKEPEDDDSSYHSPDTDFTDMITALQEASRVK